MTSATRTRHERPRRKNVLVVALAFPPSATPGAVSAAHMAVHLPRHGWSPTFLTIRRDRLLVPHARGRGHPLPSGDIAVRRTSIIYPWRITDRLGRPQRQSAAPARAAASDSTPAAGASQPAPAPAPGPRPRRGLTALCSDLLRFPDPQCGWIPFAILGGLAAARGRTFDCLYSSGPPWTCHLVGLALHALLRKPWVAEFRDPWAANPWHYRQRPWPLGGIEAQLEQCVLASAAAIVARTPEAAALLAERGGRVHDRRFTTIPGAYDADEIAAARRLAKKHAGTFVLTHAGRFYGPRSPVPLLTAIARLAETPELAQRLELRLVGERDPRVQALAERLGIAPLLRQVGLASHLQTMQHILESDLAVVVQPATGVQVPSKVYEYLGCGVPILALTGEGATARLIREARAGVVVPPNDVEAIAAAIRAFCTGGVAAESVRPDPEVVGQFEASAVIGRVADLLESVSDRSRRGRR
jgi:glycosyltransferase involved in cell wall biosynthesis